MGDTSYVPSSTSQGSGPVRAATHTVERAPQSATNSSSGAFAGSGAYCDSTTSTSSTASPLLWEHKDATEPAPASLTEATPKRESFGKVNAYSYCGRHSKEFLFGGKGFHDLWRAVRKK
ncbi:uncharacterized protein P884DRAFT_234300 [Thermothelomyces heterothallicus CBS 202.75]|uniref:uncharacterized protein n=1 Tax=Thermothelomyces heterothallicus CBS 202.75 TaxID=1149848 RepID=UPI003742BE27